MRCPQSLAPPPRLAPAHGTRERALHDAWLHCINTELDAQGLYVLRKHQHLAHIYGISLPAQMDIYRVLLKIRVSHGMSKLRSGLAAP